MDLTVAQVGGTIQPSTCFSFLSVGVLVWCVGVRVEPRGWRQGFPAIALCRRYFFFRQCPSLDLELTSWLDWQSSSRGPPLLTLQVGFLRGAGAVRSGPHALMVSAFLAAPPPRFVRNIEVTQE